VRGYAGTTGSLGLYAWQAARAGLILLAVCNSEAAIAAPDGANPITGTNPIAFGFPSADGAPLIGDYASSVWPYGDIAMAGLRGEQLPPGVVLDSEGSPSTDPADADAGSMLPSGGHRGFVQSVLVELLCGALVGGKIGAEASPGDAALLIGFAPSAFRPGTSAEAQVQALKNQIEGSKRIAGQPAPHSPGARYASLLEDLPTAIEVSEVVRERLRGAGVTL
jgi:LDH2 family malate/lactate/ureidoglycolate dehydrogenase